MKTNRFPSTQRRPLVCPGALLTVLFVLAVGPSVSVQAQTAASAAPSTDVVPVSEMYDMQLETEMLEQQFDRVITDALDRYFDRASFLVRVSLAIEKENVRIVEPSAPPEEEEVEEVAPVRIPGVPYVPNFVERERSFAEDMAALIGQSYTRTVVRQVQVDLRVDIGYDEDEIAFMEDIIRTAARLSEARGDLVLVNRAPFPGPEFERQARQRNEEMRAEQEALESEAEDRTMHAGGGLPGPEAISAMLSDAEGRRALAVQLLAHPTYLLLSVFILIMFLATVMLLILLFRGVPVRSKGARTAAATAGAASDERGYASGAAERTIRRDDSGETARSATPRRQTESSPLLTQESDPSSIDPSTSDARYVSGLLSTYPADLARYFEKRIETGQQRGLRQVAGLFQLIDHKMIRMLEPYMKQETFAALRREISDFSSSAGESSDKENQALIAYLKSSERPDSYLFKIQPLRDFEFVRNVSASLFERLVADMKDTDTALIVGHMPKNVIQQWFAEQPSDRIQRIVRTMPLVHKITYTEYSGIAERLFDLHEKHKTGDAYSQSLVTEMVDLIESMPMKRQQRMVRALREEDSEYNRSILSRLITFENVLELPDPALVQVLEVFDAETIAMACTSLSEEQTTRVLNTRSNREKSVVNNLLRTKASGYDDMSVSEARLRIVREARPFIRREEEQPQGSQKTASSSKS